MRFLLRLVALAIVVYAGLSIFKRVVGLLAPLRANSRLRASGGGRLVKDPVCGTHIPEETALHARNQYFCSEECRAKFLES
jgi:hypothetical protein